MRMQKRYISAAGLREEISRTFHTINDFRGNTMREAVRVVFTKVLELLITKCSFKP
jgi:hypothetical protein